MPKASFFSLRKEMLEEVKKKNLTTPALGCQTTHENGALVKECDTLLVALKPNVVPAVLEEVAPAVQPRHLVVSLAMGVTLADIQQVTIMRDY
ncbi:hypothetical protein HPB48_013072 [Haemaphysalis longicornis]|uniref:Pyrroline-5-carboxylate reductase catalytic N-terminal domain-containing protein n=1 Tax=Haemaphysalis longicornis TaxID=44386 RepID=A0A9J6GCR9_HAELO|nr:hypothetical protein HPB48_013072 [Haemaphysalis longicornis]